MKARLIICGILGLSLLTVVIWFFYGFGAGLSGSDILSVRRFIREKTGERIIDISGEGTGGVKVRTGRRGTGLDGVGMEYYLIRTNRGWEIAGRSAWTS